MKRSAIVLMILLCACAKPSSEPTEIGPEDEEASASGDAEATGGAGGSYSPDLPMFTSAGAGAPGDGGSDSSSSGSRLRVASYVGSDGSRFVRGDAFDSMLGTMCSFAVAADGVVRCTPGPLAASIFYADPACTTETVSPFDECEAKSHMYMSAQSYSAECPSMRRRSFKISNPRFAASYLKLDGSACSGAGDRWIVDAVEVAPATLVEMSSRVEGM